MPFTGRPSVGCALCKQRKKKCDRTRPQCKRCTTSGKECPGVPDEIDVVFRNKFALGDTNENRLATANITFALIKPNAAQCCGTLAGNDASSVVSSIAPNVPTDWLATAATYYFNLHCQKNLPTRRLNPWLGLQLNFYATPTSESGLSHAVHALAALTMSDELGIPGLAQIAHRTYGKALRAINSALTDPQRAIKNDVVVGIFAMISFELKQNTSERRIRHQAHVDGMRQLLLLRGRQQLADIESLRVFRALRVLVVYNHTLRAAPLFTDDTGLIWTDANPYNATPVDDLCAVAARIPDVRFQAVQLKISKSSMTIQTLMQKTLDIESKLDEWLLKWQDHMKFDVTSVVETDPRLWNNRAHVFVDLALAVLMNHYHYLRLLVKDVMLRCLQSADHGLDHMLSKQSDLIAQIRILVDNICYSIPFITGQVREKGQNVVLESGNRWIYPSHAEATWILLPIAMAFREESIGGEQRNWLKQQLIRLNANFGLIDASSMPRGTNERLGIQSDKN